MNKIIILLLTMSSYSCVSTLHVERCAVSVQFEKCRCHLYDFWKAKRISVATDYEIDYCDNVVGFHAEDWATKITPAVRKLNHKINND